MEHLPAQLLGQACRIFLDIAYPNGPDTIPKPRLPFYGLGPNDEVNDLLPPSELTKGLVNLMTGTNPGYSIRLGSAGFPYLRLTIQNVDHGGERSWVCGVDTHDSWHHPDHPDAIAWTALQATNRELKSRIEHAWDAAGILTHTTLLRQELQSSQKP